MSFPGLSLEGRTAVVLGGTSGIGLALTKGLADAGADVVATSRRMEQVEEAAGEVEARGRRTLRVAADVMERASLQELLRKVLDGFGKLDVLVNCAGRTKRVPTLEMSDEDWSTIIETNLTGSFRVAKRAAKGMLRLRRGRIVFVSSVVGLLGSAGQVNYAASKSGLVGMARSIARELGSRNITANVVAPGFVNTDMTDVLTDEQKATIKQQVPLGRYAEPAEVAGAVTWLASADAAYVTGQVLSVSGGLTMNG